MQLTEEDIKEFTRGWKIAFGEELSPEEARKEARRLFTFYAELAKPLPGERRGDPPEPIQ